VRARRFRPRAARRPVAALALTILAAASAVGIAAFSPLEVRALPPPAPARFVAVLPPNPAPNGNPIRHIVVLVQENHAFDNYFGTYCQAVGPYCPDTANGLPTNVCMPYNPNNTSIGCLRPYPLNDSPGAVFRDIAHTWFSSHIAYNLGAMNGFYIACGSPLAMGYYNGSVIGGYWDLAEQYALGDNFFSSVLSYSLPEHWYLLAGQAPRESDLYTLGGRLNETNTSNNSWALTPGDRSYLNEANVTPTIAPLLDRAGISWKYYDWVPQPSYARALSDRAFWGGAFDYWDPFLALPWDYNSSETSHLVAGPRVLDDIRNATLPTVSWVMPPLGLSEHPPYWAVAGESWSTSIIDAIERSPYWNSTAIFLTWDEYGGFYDHVPPSLIDQYGFGFRVPLLVVSPYTPQDEIVHEYGSFDSLLRFVEWRLGLPGFTPRDTNAPLPLEYFDFAAAPRPPYVTPVGTAASYPDPLQPLPPPLAPAALSGARSGDNVTLAWNETPGGSPVGGYRVTYGPTAGGPFVNVTLPAGSRGVRLAGLAGGIGYTFSVVAVDGSLASKAASWTADVPPVSATLGLDPDPYGPLWLLGVLVAACAVSAILLPRRLRPQL
jgi:phospholipase C